MLPRSHLPVLTNSSLHEACQDLLQEQVLEDPQKGTSHNTMLFAIAAPSAEYFHTCTKALAYVLHEMIMNRLIPQEHLGAQNLSDDMQGCKTSLG